MVLPIRIWFCAGLLIYSTCVISAEAKAEDEPQQQAQEHYNKAKAFFTEGKYEQAMEEFTESYNLSSNPDLLYNLAVCAEKLGDVERATAYYEVYLEERPDAPDVDKVRAHLEKLKAGEPTGKEPTLVHDRPAEPVEEARQAKDEESTAGGTPVVDEETLDKDMEDVLNQEKDDTHIFWPGLTMGLGGLVLASGGVTAILAYKKHKDLEAGCAPTCDDDDVSSAKGTALAADIQFAVGAAAVITGVFLWIFDKEEETDVPVAWRAGPAAISKGAQLIVEGRF